MAFVRAPLWQRLWRREPLSSEERLLALVGVGSILYGVLAGGLAVRAGQGLLVPLIVAGWRDGQPVQRPGAGGLGGGVGVRPRGRGAARVVAIGPGRVLARDQAAFDALVAGDLVVRAKLEAALAYRQEVAEMALFRDLSSAELDVLLARLVPLEAATGETIIRQGDSGERFYVVRSVAVAVQRDYLPLAALVPGEAVGGIASLLAVP